MVNFKRLSWTKNTLSNILLNQVDTEREFMSYSMLLKPDMYSNVQVEEAKDYTTVGK